jgi:hypothetical protein
MALWPSTLRWGVMMMIMKVNVVAVVVVVPVECMWQLLLRVKTIGGDDDDDAEKALSR